MTKTDDVFTVFISHKHDDHALALEVKKALQGLAGPKPIDCFVSGTDITVGMDWRREIRSVLARSHVLVLLFTAPSKEMRMFAGVTSRCTTLRNSPFWARRWA